MEKSFRGQISLNGSACHSLTWGFRAHVNILKALQRACSKKTTDTRLRSIGPELGKTVQGQQVQGCFIMVWSVVRTETKAVKEGCERKRTMGVGEIPEVESTGLAC